MAHKVKMLCSIYNLVFTLVLLRCVCGQVPAKLPVGVFYQRDVQENVQKVIEFSWKSLNKLTTSIVHLQMFPSTIATPSNDSYSIWNAACDLMKRNGFFMMLSDGNFDTLKTYDSVAKRMHMPYISWNIPSNSLAGVSRYTASVRPPTDEILADFVIKRKWKRFIYMHDGHDASLNLQRIFTWVTLKSRSKPTSEQTLPLVDLVRIPDDDSQIHKFIFDMHKARDNKTGIAQHVIVDLSSTERHQQLVKTLLDPTLTNAEIFHYIIADFGLSPPTIQDFTKGQLNFTTLQIINRDTSSFDKFALDLLKFEQLQKSFEPKNFYTTPDLKIHELEAMKNKITAEMAFAADAMRVVVQTFKDVFVATNKSVFERALGRGVVMNYDQMGLYCNPSENHENPKGQFQPFHYGSIIAESMRKVRLNDTDTLTGPIRFNEFGVRVGYVIEVVDFAVSKKSHFSIQTLHTWRQGQGFDTNSHSKEERNFPEKDTFGRKRIVSTVFTAPFIMETEGWKEKGLKESDRFEGYCVDLLKLLSDEIGFDYEIRIVKDGGYGGENPDGTWNGMIGEILRGEADFAVAPLTITRVRERVVDFSKPFMTTGISIMIREPDEKKFSVFSFMQPLSTEIWMYIIFAYVGVSVVIFLVSRFSPYEWRVEEMANGTLMISNDFSVYNCLWFTLAAFMQQGTDILPRSISGRIASSAWWFFTMIMISSYTANLAAFLTSEKLQTSIETVEDLAKQTKIKYGIQGGGSTAFFFQHSTVQTYQRMWQYMESQIAPSVFVSTYAEGIKRVQDSKGKYAFLLEATANEYANTRLPCQTMKVGDLLNSVGYGVATPFGSDMKNELNLAILELQERGELKKLENKWWYASSECIKDAADGTSTSLDIKKVAGIFYILIGGMIVAMVTAMGELMYRSRIEARKGKKTLGSSMRTQLSLSLKGDNIGNIPTPNIPHIPGIATNNNKKQTVVEDECVELAGECDGQLVTLDAINTPYLYSAIQTVQANTPL